MKLSDALAVIGSLESQKSEVKAATEFIEGYECKQVLSLYVAMELYPLIASIVKERSAELGQKSSEPVIEACYLGVVSVVDSHQLDGPQYARDLGQWIKGESVKTARAVITERRWPLLRKRVLEKMNAVVNAELRQTAPGIGLQVQDQVTPILVELGKNALDAAKGMELTPKESLKAFTELARLQAQLKGELVNKAEVSVSGSEAFGRLLTLTDEQFKAIELPYEPEVALIE